MKTRYKILTGLVVIFVMTIVIGTMTLPVFLEEPNWSTIAIIESALVEERVEDIEECLSWAFGDDYKELGQFEFDDAWRRIHSDLFIIRGSDSMVESARRIATAWMAHGQRMYWIDGNGNKGEIFGFKAGPNDPETKIKILEGNGLLRIDFDNKAFEEDCQLERREYWHNHTIYEDDEILLILIPKADILTVDNLERYVEKALNEGTKIYFKDEK